MLKSIVLFQEYPNLDQIKILKGYPVRKNGFLQLFQINSKSRSEMIKYNSKMLLVVAMNKKINQMKKIQMMSKFTSTQEMILITSKTMKSKERKISTKPTIS